MKAVLVIDMPKRCSDCPIFTNCSCLVLCRWNTRALKERPSWCPLRPLPQKKEVEVNEIDDIMHTEYSIKDIYTDKYVADIRLATDKLISLGWNACLDTIVGEVE